MRSPVFSSFFSKKKLSKKQQNTFLSRGRSNQSEKLKSSFFSKKKSCCFLFFLCFSIEKHKGLSFPKDKERSNTNTFQKATKKHFSCYAQLKNTLANALPLSCFFPSLKGVVRFLPLREGPESVCF